MLANQPNPLTLTGLNFYNEYETLMSSAANFIFFRVREPKRVFEELCTRGVLIREYANALRVSVGTPEQNDRFLDGLQEAV